MSTLADPNEELWHGKVVGYRKWWQRIRFWSPLRADKCCECGHTRRTLRRPWYVLHREIREGGLFAQNAMVIHNVTLLGSGPAFSRECIVNIPRVGGISLDGISLDQLFGVGEPDVERSRDYLAASDRAFVDAIKDTDDADV